jgi:3-deoxy-D-manno-octulosonate 8-phosphate phosphatase (KDO 8-P phosphatase)
VSPNQQKAPNAFPVEQARRIRLVVFDVDGVLTDASVLVGAGPGERTMELKSFDIQDGIGMKLLGMAGLVVAIVSGRYSEATTIRARELGIEDCLQDTQAQKLQMMEGLMQKHGVSWEEVAMVGDDIPDLPVFKKAGLPVAVANATPEVLPWVLWQSRATGGRGAVREFCRELLVARGQWDDVVRRYVEERGG